MFHHFKIMKYLISFIFTFIFLSNSFCYADRIKDMASLAGVRSNQLVGYGLVIGLAKTGDGSVNLTKQSIAAMIAQFVVMQSTGVNDYYPESQYIWGYDVPKKWNDYKIFYENMDRTNIIIQAESRGIDEIHGSELRNPLSVNVKSPNNFSSLNSFLGNIEKHRISHLVVDGKNDRPEFLNDIFYNEEKYLET